MKIIGLPVIWGPEDLLSNGKGVQFNMEDMILTKRIDSTTNRNELPTFLKNFATEENYPVGRVRWSEGQERFFGYGQGYLVAAAQLPPIPGGWDLSIEKTPIEEKKIWVPDTLLRSANTASGLPRLLDSYLQEGLVFEELEANTMEYDVAGNIYLVKGHPRLIEMFEQVLDGF